MKNIKLLLLVIITSLSFSSCDKFLEENPKGLIATSNFYKNDNEAKGAINGVYAATRADVTGTNAPIYLVEQVSDDGALGGTALGERVEIDNLVYNSQHNYIRQIWATAYTVIFRANTVLASVDSINVTPSLTRRIHGEAKFLRAFYYFRLVQLYGNVPLLLTPTTADNLNPSRTATLKVYEQIIEDLKYAEINLVDKYSYTDPANGGRVTAAAAKALLGKVYLTMAGYPVMDVSKYQLAFDKLNEVVVNKAIYGLEVVTNFADIFNVTRKAANTENLFYYRGTSGLSADLRAFTRLRYMFITFSMIIPTREVRVGLFEAGDLRRGGTIDATGGRVNKYIDIAATGNNDNQDDWHNIRYSDVLLMYAECLIEIGGQSNLESALAIINDLRRKHGGSSLPLLTFTGNDDLRTKYRLERRKELMYEGHRYYDLKRWGIFIATIKQHLAFQANRPISNYSYINDKNLLLPIPYGDMIANPNLVQNPGY